MPGAAGGAPGERGSGYRLESTALVFFEGEKYSGLGNALLLDARADRCDDNVGVVGSPCVGSSIISWYQSYERKLKLGLGGGRSPNESRCVLLSMSGNDSTRGLDGSDATTEPRPDNKTVSSESLFFGYALSSYSRFCASDVGACQMDIGGGA